MLQRLRHVFSERLNVAKAMACVLREAKCCTALDQTSEHTSAQPNNIALPPLGRWVLLTETSPRLHVSPFREPPKLNFLYLWWSLCASY